MIDLGYELWLLASLGIAVFVTKHVANNFGAGWGVAAFFGCVFIAAVAANTAGIELDGAGCVDYGPRAQASDYC